MLKYHIIRGVCMKNIISLSYKKLLSFFLCTFLCLASPLSLLSAPKNPMADMSPEQMQQIEKELSQAAKEIDNYVNSLPPEQQQEFHQAVQELQSELEKMSDEELEGFVNELFTSDELWQEETPEAPQQSISQPTAIQEIPKAKIKKVKPVAPTSKQQQAIEMIKSIISSTESLLTKSETLPEINDKVVQWIKKGQLFDWPQTNNWESIKAAIESFNQKLNKMLEKDPHTSKYRFLDELVTNEALFNNLSHIRTVFADKVPEINIAIFGMTSLDQTSKQALQRVLSKFGEAINTLKLPQELDKVIEKFDPQAKALREKEEQARKKALESSKQKPTNRPTVYAGRRDPEIPAATPQYDDFYSDPFSQPSSSGSSRSTRKKQPAKKEEPQKKDAGKKSEKKKDDTSKLGEHLTKIEKEIKVANKAANNKTMINMYTHLRSNEPVDTDVAQYNLPTTIKHVQAAASHVSNLKNTMLDMSDTTKKRYKVEVENRYKKYGKNLETVYNQLNKVAKEWKSIQPGLSQEKKYAYVGSGRPHFQQENTKDDSKKSAKLTVKGNATTATAMEAADANVVNAQEIQEAGQELQGAAQQIQQRNPQTNVQGDDAQVLQQVGQELQNQSKKVNPKKKKKEQQKQAEQKKLEGIQKEVPNPGSILALHEALKELKEAIKEIDQK